MELGFLSPLYERPGPWASVCFGTSFTTEDAAARHELSARAAGEQLAEQGADSKTCRAVYEALAALPRTDAPAGRAVFAADGEVVLDPALAEEPPGGLQTWWAPLPHTAPLLELADGHPSCLVAYIDRTGADFELRGPLGAASAGTVTGEEWPLNRTASKDWSERRFQQGVEDTWERNAAVVAENLAACRTETGAELIVLAGDPRQRRAVRDRLPESDRAVAAETEFGGRAEGSSSPQLEAEIEELRAAHARRRVEATVDRFLAARAPDTEGRLDAVEGTPALVDAAREHRIATLLVRPDAPETHREVWVGREPDQVAVRRTEVQYLGDTDPEPARADDALLRSAAVTGAEVLSVGAVAKADGDLPAGGLGALLRWPVESEGRAENRTPES
ncbi:Vms1/Ankzf1 family peptidyl-tRNA hydrolase [Streptomyces sodiiphilus]|uniref:Vms1/Ankzf1 family peptidyl-tRNA hydrolase n=1 Tax=Streptomyces sodiiphilus TaxID=226217 RepID=A0ABP5A274_9ACTN